MPPKAIFISGVCYLSVYSPPITFVTFSSLKGVYVSYVSYYIEFFNLQGKPLNNISNHLCPVGTFHHSMIYRQTDIILSNSGKYIKKKAFHGEWSANLISLPGNIPN